jgi:hypothetical protein
VFEVEPIRSGTMARYPKTRKGWHLDGHYDGLSERAGMVEMVAFVVDVH